jgi:hypothetical protein
MSGILQVFFQIIKEQHYYFIGVGNEVNGVDKLKKLSIGHDTISRNIT